MPNWPHFCVGCGVTHNALLWYYRDPEDGFREYLCAEKFNLAVDKTQWQLFDQSS